MENISDWKVVEKSNLVKHPFALLPDINQPL